MSQTNLNSINVIKITLAVFNNLIDQSLEYANTFFQRHEIYFLQSPWNSLIYLLITSGSIIFSSQSFIWTLIFSFFMNSLFKKKRFCVIIRGIRFGTDQRFHNCMKPLDSESESETMARCVWKTKICSFHILKINNWC